MKRFDVIDALRGLAIAGVVLVHTGRQAMPPSAMLRAVMNLGASGVHLFFVVSALTLCLSWVRRRRCESRPLRNFLIRRVARVAPMFYLAIALYLGLHGMAPGYWTPNGIQIPGIVATIFFVHGFHPETINAVVPGGWSIAAEMEFYASLALCLPALGTARSTLLFLGTSLVLFILNAIVVPHLFTYPAEQHYLVPNFIRFNFFGQLPVFAAGVVASTAFRYGTTDWRVAAGAALCMLVAAVCWWRAPQPLCTPAVGAFFAGAALLLAQRPARLFVNRVTIALGKRSFSIFLLHFAVLDAFSHSGAAAWFAGSNAGSVLEFLCVLSATAALSTLTWRWVEQPGIACGARLVATLERTSVWHTAAH
ncbi:acyltransferase [Massilia sp. TW-1]|uniref:Acyltransferase n=1 Tax=Telluria antibiotica TaxID=2717319 RepID=A0ABX0PIT5_9BURK|nr:acyltransferase [Telluria antibiotica]NIA57351.1 acyltransferase [Telluria antibiotica]